MALSNITSIPNPYDPATPIVDAYAYAAGLALDVSTGQGKITYNVHPNANAWQGTPVAQVTIALGGDLVPGDPFATPPVPAVKMPTLAELLANPAFAQAFATIATILDGHAKDHARFAGSAVTGVA